LEDALFYLKKSVFNKNQRYRFAADLYRSGGLSVQLLPKTDKSHARVSKKIRELKLRSAYFSRHPTRFQALSVFDQRDLYHFFSTFAAWRS
jgi:hypothetical protein